MEEFYRHIMAFTLVGARIGGAMAICPALTDSMIPGSARKCIVVAFSAIAVPFILRQMPPDITMNALMVYGAKEAVIGFLLGFFSAIPFWIAENVGNFIDNQRGATMGEVYSPLSGTQVSTTGIFFTQIMTTLFFISGGILLLLGAIYGSYKIWPVFEHLKGMSPDTPKYMLDTLDHMMGTTVVLAAPVIIVMFLATLGLGFVNRTAPQLNVFFLSMPIKSALGIFMLILYLQYILNVLVYPDEDSLLTPLRHLLIG